MACRNCGGTGRVTRQESVAVPMACTGLTGQPTGNWFTSYENQWVVIDCPTCTDDNNKEDQ